MTFKHISVLLDECIEGLAINPQGIYVDGTMGGAGHTKVIASKLTSGTVVGIDQDLAAHQAAATHLLEYKDRVAFVHSNFQHLKEALAAIGIFAIDGLLLDLGVSSYQLDTAERGFSYMHDGKLDMRMNQDGDISAYDVVNHYDEHRLTDIIRRYGEENWASRIAKFICEARATKPLETTYELVDVIKHAIPARARQDGPHPAKRTFQAIRIEVNNELKIIENTIIDAMSIMNPGGRIAIITFHSLEDRIVKETYKRLAQGFKCPPEFPICVCGETPVGKLITRKPIIPSQQEIEENPRSRSAKLRVIEKI